MNAERGLVERLRAKKTQHKLRPIFGGAIALPDADETREVLVNPDGPEAADLIERLTAQPEGDLDGRARELLAAALRAEGYEADADHLYAARDAHALIDKDAALAAIRAALSQAQGGEEGLREAAWLVERDDPNGLFYASTTRWERDHDKALRFAREADALAFAEANKVPCQGGFCGWCNYTRVAEHRWG